MPLMGTPLNMKRLLLQFVLVMLFVTVVGAWAFALPIELYILFLA
jgi:hypothetical protein